MVVVDVTTICLHLDLIHLDVVDVDVNLFNYKEVMDVATSVAVDAHGLLLC